MLGWECNPTTLEPEIGMSAICPHCKNHVLSVNMASVTGQGLSSNWKCILYSCPHCNAPISSQIDPTLIREEIIDGVMERLKSDRR